MMNSLNFWHCPQACYSMSLMTICLEWGLLGWLAIILLAALSAFPLSVSIPPPPSLPSSLLPFLSHFTTSCIQQEREQGHVRQSEVKAGCGRVEFVLISVYTNMSERRTISMHIIPSSCPGVTVALAEELNGTQQNRKLPSHTHHEVPSSLTMSSSNKPLLVTLQLKLYFRKP